MRMLVAGLTPLPVSAAFDRVLHRDDKIEDKQRELAPLHQPTVVIRSTGMLAGLQDLTAQIGYFINPDDDG